MDELLGALNWLVSTLDHESRLALIMLLVDWWRWQDGHLFDDVAIARSTIVQALSRGVTPEAPAPAGAPLHPSSPLL